MPRHRRPDFLTTEETPMLPNELPTDVTDRIYSAPFENRLSQNDVKTLLAHFWPAIAEHVRKETVPAWEAVYEPGNVSDYLIGYANDEDPAKAAAASWFVSQRADEVGRLVWAKQPHGDSFTAWFDLIHVDPELGEVSTGITVRCRALGAGQ